jgi:hypothetical protein
MGGLFRRGPRTAKISPRKAKPAWLMSGLAGLPTLERGLAAFSILRRRANENRAFLYALNRWS